MPAALQFALRTLARKFFGSLATKFRKREIAAPVRARRGRCDAGHVALPPTLPKRLSPLLENAWIRCPCRSVAVSLFWFLFF